MANVGTIEAKVGLDLTELKKKQKEVKSRMQRISSTMIRIAKQAAKATGVALAAFGAYSIKLASDFEETSSKFNTAFKGVEKQAERSARILQKAFLMSGLEAKRLLSSTADLLKGFGMTAKEALDTSHSVQRLAADLASYNNLQGGTKRASEALTKAMLGQRESLTSLGIRISEADVKSELLARGMKNLTGQALLAARAQVTLDLAMRQSGDAMGDIMRTSGSFANQLKLLRARITDAAIAIGKLLLPLATKFLNFINSKLTDENINKVRNALLRFFQDVKILFSNIATVIIQISLGFQKLFNIDTTNLENALKILKKMRENAENAKNEINQIEKKQEERKDDVSIGISPPNRSFFGDIMFNVKGLFYDIKQGFKGATFDANSYFQSLKDTFREGATESTNFEVDGKDMGETTEAPLAKLQGSLAVIAKLMSDGAMAILDFADKFGEYVSGTLAHAGQTFSEFGRKIESDFMVKLGSFLDKTSQGLTQLQFAAQQFKLMQSTQGLASIIPGLGVAAGVIGAISSFIASPEEDDKDWWEENTRELERNTEAMQGLNNSIFNLSRSVRTDVLRARTASINPQTGVV